MSDRAKSINKKSWNTLYMGFCIVYIISFIFCFFKDNSRILSLLPLAALLCFILVKYNKLAFNNMSILVVNILTLIRYALYPFSIVLNGENFNPRYQNSTAVYLMIYELIGVFLIIGIFGKKLVDYDAYGSSKNVTSKQSGMGIVTVLLLVALPCLLVVYPSLLINQNSSGGIISAIYSMCIWTLVVSIFIVLCGIRSNNNILIRITGLLLSLLFAGYYVFSMSFGNTNVNRWLIIAAGLATASVVIHFFPEYRKKIIGIVAVGIAATVFVGTFVKFNNTSISLMAFYEEYLSVDSVDAYFSGIDKITHGLNMIDVVPGVRTFQSTLTDFFGSMPLISKLFNSSSESTVAYFLAYMHRTDLICPTMIQSVAHFGVLGAPILSMLFTYIAIMLNKRLKKTNNPFEIFTLVELTFYCSAFFCINMSIILEHMWFRLLYLILLRFNIPVRFGDK